MSIPLIVFAGIYFALFLVWIVLTLVNVYHVLRYASWTKIPLVLVFVYLAFSVVIVGATGWLLRDIDWSRQVSLDPSEISVPVDLPGGQTNN